jgi:Leucine-rich repeat (LRR) protein
LFASCSARSARESDGSGRAAETREACEGGAGADSATRVPAADKVGKGTKRLAQKSTPKHSIVFLIVFLQIIRNFANKIMMMRTNIAIYLTIIGLSLPVLRAQTALKTWDELAGEFNYPSIEFAISEKAKARRVSLYDYGETFSERIALAENLEMIQANRIYLKRLPATLVQMQRLQWLELRFNWIAELPDELANVAELRRLDVRGNWFEAFPKAIPNMPKLLYLDIAQNKIDSLPDDIRQCSLLTHLDLSKSKYKALPPLLGTLDKLEYLDISYNQIPVLPTNFTNFKALRYLNISQNPLKNTKTLSKDISNFSQLEQLYIGGIGLTSLDNTFYALTQLRVLNLDGNKLERVAPELGKFTLLESLDLSGNKLDSLPENTVSKLQNLTYLNLEANKLTVLPADLGKLPLLKKLNIGVNSFQALPNSIGDLAALEELSVVNTPLRTLPTTFKNLNITSLKLGYSRYLSQDQAFGVIAQMPKLEYFSLRTCYFRTLSAKISVLSKLTTLVELDLYDNLFREIPASIGQLKQIKILRLGSNELKTIPATIGDMISLEYLDLGDNELKTIPDNLKNLTNLKHIIIGGNPLPKETVAQLKEWFPNAIVQ